MEILAWVIVVLTISFIVLPAAAGFISGDQFIEYKAAWVLGNGLALAFTALFFGIAAIGWAFKTVFG